MKPRFLFFCAATAITAFCAFGREATLFMANPNRGGGPAGIYSSHFPSGATSQVLDKYVHWACIAPDGKKIGFVVNDSLYSINIDGTGQTLLLTADDFDGAFHDKWDMFWAKQIEWTKAGIFWIAENKVYRYIVESKTLSVVVDVTELGNVCVRDYEDGIIHGAMIYCSVDGLRMWSRKLHMDPFDRTHYSDWAQTFLQSDKAVSRGYTRDSLGCYSHRTLRPFIQFKPDFSDYTVVWDHQWGHGRGMTANGSLLLVNHGYHRALAIYEPQDGNRVGSIYPWDNKYDPPIPRGFDNQYPVTCINNDSLLGGQSVKCHEKHNPDCPDEGRRVWFYNWRADTLYGEFVLPRLNEWGEMIPVGIWDGPLPTLPSEPYIGVTPNNLTFNYDGKTQPAPQTVTVSNIGKKTLGKVSVSIAPAGATWLSVSVPDGGGNTQALSNGIVVQNISADQGQATVTVSGGGASNSVTYTVSCYKGALIAPPTELAVAEAGDSLLDAKLTWKDNAANETGYRIERKKEGGAWEEIAKTGADATTYTDKRLDYHTKYFYRLRAFVESGKDTRYSQYSKEQFVTIAGIAWVRIRYPNAGDAVKAGSKTVIKWQANDCDVAVIKLSTDDGLSWTEVTQKGGIVDTDPGYGNFEWQVPEVDVTTARLYIGLYPGDLDPFAVTGAFTISPDASVSNYAQQHQDAASQYGIRMLNEGKIMAWTGNEAAQMRVYSVNGKLVANRTLLPQRSTVVSTHNTGAGLYLYELRRNNGTILTKGAGMAKQ